MKKNPLTTIILPTFNESDNISPLVKAIEKAMKGYNYDVLFIDDSTDETSKVIAKVISNKKQFKLIKRGGRGLSTAFLLGFEKAKGDIVVCMDSDLQHPPKYIPSLIDAIIKDGDDMAVASRYCKGGSSEGLSSWYRRFVSKASTWMAWLVLPPTKRTTDPMTGFFAFKKSILDGRPLKPTGYKILVEMLVTYFDIKVCDVPFTFASRQHEESKADVKQGLKFFKHLAHLFVRTSHIHRFLKFAIVGASGVLVNLGLLYILFDFVGLHEKLSWLLAVFASIFTNYLGNSKLTFRDRHDTNVASGAERFGVFVLSSAVTMIVNYVIYQYLRQGGMEYMLAATISIVVVVLLNFFLSRVLVWGKSDKSFVERFSVDAVVLGGVIGVFTLVSMYTFVQFVSFASVVEVVIAFISVLLIAQGLFALWLMLYAWDNPDAQIQHASPKKFSKPELSFTALLPCKHEKDVIAYTIKAVDKMQYPEDKKEIIVVIHEDSDDGTIDVVKQTIKQLDKPNIRLITFTGEPVNKPRGLNIALLESKGDVVTIFDSEDEPHPELFHVINTVMLRDEAQVVQSGVQLMNFESNWYSLFNVLEYFFWFKSSLHFFAKQGVVPLGGNSVFFKRDWLHKVNGWDQTCLTEDCDIGFKLSQLGAKTSVVYDSKHATQEETPPNLWSFIKQRTRWAQGFLQIMSRRQWMRLPTIKQRLFAVYILSWPFILGGAFIMMPISIILGLSVKLPPALAVLSNVPLFIFVLFLLTNILGIYEFTQAYKKPFKWWKLIPQMIIFFYPYALVLGFSAARAVYRNLKKNTSWEKTEHLNTHRQTT